MPTATTFFFALHEFRKGNFTLLAVKITLLAVKGSCSNNDLTMRVPLFALIGCVVSDSALAFFRLEKAIFHSPPTTPAKTVLSSSLDPVADSLLGINAGDEFTVVMPEKPQLKKAWSKRRRSQSPLVAQVVLENEEDVFGANNHVRTFLRLGSDAEPQDIVPGQKLRAFVAEVRPSNGDRTDTNKPSRK